MNLLVTSSRLPVALDEIRKFGRRGHRITAADTFRTAPGSYSRHVSARVTVAPPQFLPERFLGDVKQLMRTRAIDLVVPCFEEVFYLARHLDELSELAPVFTSGFPLLARLHDKAAFARLARELGVATPDTTVVRSRAELLAALRRYPRYFARPAFSRGGLDVLTNVGPLAGALDGTPVEPSLLQPWVVQEYIDGVDICSFSVARHGHLVAHCSYIHPQQIEHAGGIVFESIVDGDTLACAERIIAATGYHGQIGFDFRRSDGELRVLECNPRPTAGVHLMSDRAFVDAVLSPVERTVHVVPAGVRRLYASALVRDLVLHRTNFKADVAHLLSSAPDIYGEKGDRLPAIFQVLSYTQVLAYLRRRRTPRRAGTTLLAAYFDGIVWDGQPIP